MTVELDKVELFVVELEVVEIQLRARCLRLKSRTKQQQLRRGRFLSPCVVVVVSHPQQNQRFMAHYSRPTTAHYGREVIINR